MKFGKLRSVDQVDFSLPKEPPENQEVLNKEKDDSPTRLYIGATGWGMKEWVGKYYPPKTKSAEYLHHYSKQFNTIELNTTHYRIPDELTIQKWYEQSTQDFKFCPKVLQRISHSRELSPEGPANLIHQFCTSIYGLKEKLGPCFIQLPPYFGADRIPTLKAFLQNWRPFGLPLAVEVRHESWFDSPKNFTNLIELLKEYEVSTVITDVAGRRDVCHSYLTNASVVIRFVGNDLHSTDYSRIDTWSKRLKYWFEKGLKNAYFFTHEPDNILSPELAMVLVEKMKTVKGLETRGPIPLKQDLSGEQMSLF